MKKILFLFAIICVICLSSCSKDEDKNLVATPEGKVVLHDNVKIIDSIALPLNMDAALLSQGKYEFSFSGTIPNISAGDVIVGDQRNGFLRQVTAMEVVGRKISLQTVQASMSNVFKTGKFKLDLSSETNRTASLGAFSRTFEPQTLFQSGPLTLTLDQGNIDYNSKWIFDFDFKESGLNYFEMVLDNANLNASIKTTLTASQSAIYTESRSMINGPQTLWRKTFMVPAILLGIPVLVPVKVNVDYDILANYSNTSDATLSRSGTFTSSNSLSLGIRYANGQWIDISDYNSSSQYTLSEFTGSANITNGLSFTPRFDVKLYGVLGPYVTAGPKVEFAGHFNTVQLDSDFEVSGLLTSSLGAKAEIFDKILFDRTLGPFELLRNSLYRRPDKITKVSGDQQSGTYLQMLSNTLKVKVVDSEGFKAVGVPVHFIIEDGNGNFSGQAEKMVLTDNEGFAEVLWTLGASGIQRIRAVVKKADSTNILYSPIEFSAQVCDESVTDYDGNLYCTSIINGVTYMTSNLKVTHYRNGDPIPLSQNITEFESYTNGAAFKDPNNMIVYYNWYAVNDARGLAPEGWRIPQMKGYP